MCTLSLPNCLRSAGLPCRTEPSDYIVGPLLSGHIVGLHCINPAVLNHDSNRLEFGTFQTLDRRSLVKLDQKAESWNTQKSRIPLENQRFIRRSSSEERLFDTQWNPLNEIEREPNNYPIPDTLADQRLLFLVPFSSLW